MNMRIWIISESQKQQPFCLIIDTIFMTPRLDLENAPFNPSHNIIIRSLPVPCILGQTDDALCNLQFRGHLQAYFENILQQCAGLETE